MDLLSDILSVLRLSGTLYFRTSFTEPWGVHVPSFENVARFHYVHRGRCCVRIEPANQAVELGEGDLIIITRGASHVLSFPHDVESPTLDQVVEQSGFNGRGALVHGGSESDAETQLICGHFSFVASAHHVLLDALPQYIHIKDYGEISPDWLDATLRIIGSETEYQRLGSDLIALKLSEVIFMQALRHYLNGEGRLQSGLAGLCDERLRASLEAIHRDPARRWSVDELAGAAGLSRTVFARRFSSLLGQTPLAYLTSWRMQLARQMLLETRLPIIEVAMRSGYQSEASFSRIFRREFARPPAEFRRVHADA